MNANWFAAHIDLLLYFYGALAIALVVWTLWRVRTRRRTGDSGQPTGKRGPD